MGADAMQNSPHETTADRLLAEADWMRALARALALDPDAAEDLVQDTWLAALHRPPSTDRSLRPWLGRVMRNFARERFRRKVRSPERETTPPDPLSELPSPQSLAERVELQQLVVRLVLDLPQPLRTTVLLRYFEGLEPLEIARRTREPAGTVRWRLKEGLDQVRAELDRRHGGDRAAWRAAFAPLFLDWKTPATTSSAAAIAFWVAAASVAVGIAVWSALPAQEAHSLAAAPQGAQRATEHATTREQASSRRATAVAASSAPSATAARGSSWFDSILDLVSNPRSSARVRFVDELDRPLAGVEFAGGVSDQVFRTESGRDGVAELATRALSGDVWADFFAHDDEGRYWSHEQLVAAGDELDFGNVRLRRGGSIRGVVRYDDGRAARGVKVVVSQIELETEARAFHDKPPGTAFWNEKLTGRDGVFEFPCLPEGPVTVWAGSQEHGWSGSGELVVQADEPLEDIVVVLKRWTAPPKVVVRVEDSEGAPVERIWMRSKSEGGRSHSGMSTNSRVELADGRTVEELWVADTSGRLGAARLENLIPREELYVLVLAPARRSWIEVVGANGRPVSEFRAVAVDAQSEFEFPSSEISEAADGRASVVVADGPFTVRVTAPGYFEGVAHHSHPADERAPARVQLAPLIPVQGRVTCADGPLAGAWVDLIAMLPEGHRATKNNAPVLLSTGRKLSQRTDADGRFSISLREAGEFAIVCRAEDLPITTRMPISIDPSTPREDLELFVGEGGSVEGVARFEDGEPLRKVPIGLSRGDFDIRTTRTDDQGRFEFEGVAAGEWYVYRAAQMIQANSHSYSSGRGRSGWVHPTNCTVREGEVERITLTYARPARIEVSVNATIDGEPGLGWSARLNPLTGLDPFDQRSFGSQVYLDAEGRAVLREAGDGLWRLWLSPRRAWQSELFVFNDVDPSTGPSDRSLTLDTCELRGSLPPASERMFALWRLRGGWIAYAPLKPDEHGEFRLLHAPAGPAAIVRGIEFAVAAEEWELETLVEFETRLNEQNFVRAP